VQLAFNEVMLFLLLGQSGAVYLACDDEPMTRKDICAAAIASIFYNITMPTFSASSGAKGKLCSSSFTRFYLL
jgi:hypothetical protein